MATAFVMGGLGDGESVKQIILANEDKIRLRYSADVADLGIAALAGGSGDNVRHVRGARTIARHDLAAAREYAYVFGTGVPEQIPGSTALGVSTAVLTDLKAGRDAPLTLRGSGIGSTLNNIISNFGGADAMGFREASGLDDIDKVSGTIRRATDTRVPVRVLVNGVPTDLPAIHARGRFDDRDADFFFLDDPDNPLALKWSIGENTLQVVTINFPPEPAQSAGALASGQLPGQIGAALASTGRAEVYGIYFDFDSATIRPESTPVLEEIAAVLREHPDWSLNVEGHTDNIGTADHNKDLSMRRAEAVAQALARDYSVDRGRLAPAGFGASRPKASNDTVEGRARNRRVELVRR